ncbi:MAG TPA: serine/threonine-protein kinase [Gemmatimonas sp.]|uniref:serine/threonine-protein kinase n=1 Tax=Gemmatimonas sp. TaxID=1962908 RepID=UPI002ED94A27
MSNQPETTPTELAALRVALSGQYAIQRELGRGGMGIVLLARDERLDRAVALKVLPPALAEAGETRERFLREARMAAQLSHPNIVPVYRADEIGGYAFFAMGFVEGESLGDRIRDRGSLPAAEVVRILREVAWALAYAHARGIVHRDVKPDNILLERASSRAIVTDFGIARADFNPALTQDGYVLGTVHYMSPEQSSGDVLDGRSDLYALGCIGFYALSGRLPFEGTSPQAILVAHATKEPPALRSVAPEVPTALAAVIDRCLRKHPDERFATGEELADALAKALEHLEHDVRDVGGKDTLNSDDAMAVWRRAAELQAEAAARLETRMRANDTRALAAPQELSGDQGSNNATGAPTDAYRLRDVEAAAIEAGISQRFVMLALDELRAKPSGQALAPSMSPRRERLTTRLLGTAQRTLSVSRTFRAPPRTVLQSLGRTLQGAPWSLALRDTLGGHPLDGGVLVFDLPAMADANYKWTYTRYGVYVPQVRVSLSAVPGDSRSCEVTMTIDLRRGLMANIASWLAVSSGSSLGGGALGLVLGKKLLALGGVALMGPMLGGAVVLGGITIASVAPMYRWGLRKAEGELLAALAAIDVAMRAFDIFGETPPAVATPRADAPIIVP